MTIEREMRLLEMFRRLDDHDQDELLAQVALWLRLVQRLKKHERQALRLGQDWVTRVTSEPEP